MITFKCIYSGQTILNTFWYAVTDITGTPTVSEYCDALLTKVASAGELLAVYQTCLSDSVSVEEVSAQVIHPNRFAKRKIAVSASGGYESSMQSGNLAAVITRRGDLAQRNNVSTLHVPLGTDGMSAVNGYVVAGLITLLENLAAEMLEPISTTTPAVTAEPCIDNGPLIGDVTPITSTSVESTVRVMRRRTVGRGI